MKNWIDKLFIQRSSLFLKLLDQRWCGTEELVNIMIRVLSRFGIESGTMLDLGCGKGRISVFMAKRGFGSVGVDISTVFLEDGRRKVEENGVSKQVAFSEGDVRKLKNVLRESFKPFDIVVSAGRLSDTTRKTRISTFSNRLSAFKERSNSTHTRDNAYGIPVD